MEIASMGNGSLKWHGGEEPAVQVFTWEKMHHSRLWCSAVTALCCLQAAPGTGIQRGSIGLIWELVTTVLPRSAGRWQQDELSSQSFLFCVPPLNFMLCTARTGQIMPIVSLTSLFFKQHNMTSIRVCLRGWPWFKDKSRFRTCWNNWCLLRSYGRFHQAETVPLCLLFCSMVSLRCFLIRQ